MIVLVGVVSFILGGITGIVLMALCQANKEE